MTTAAGFTSGLLAGKQWIDKERALYRMSRRLSQVRAEKERLSFDYVRLQREAIQLSDLVPRHPEDPGPSGPWSGLQHVRLAAREPVDICPRLRSRHRRISRAARAVVKGFDGRVGSGLRA